MIMSIPVRSAIRLCAVIGTAVTIAVLASPARAITNGSPDGTAHSYVGIASSGDEFCSGTLLSPRTFVTAGHCTADFAGSGQPTFVTFDPNAGHRRGTSPGRRTRSPASSTSRPSRWASLPRSATTSV